MPRYRSNSTDRFQDVLLRKGRLLRENLKDNSRRVPTALPDHILKIVSDTFSEVKKLPEMNDSTSMADNKEVPQLGVGEEPSAHQNIDIPVSSAPPIKKRDSGSAEAAIEVCRVR